jgi:hypothetical protein
MLYSLSLIYPANEFRTGLIKDFMYQGHQVPGFLLQYVSYFSFPAFILGMFFINYLKKKGETIYNELNIIQIKYKWAKIFNIKYVEFIISILLYFILIITLKLFGGVEPTEPLLITIAWTLDDLIGIYITLLCISISYYVMRNINAAIKNFNTFLDISNPDGICGFRSLGYLSALNSTFLNIINSIFLFPWIYFYITGGYKTTPRPFGITLFKLFIIFNIFIIILLPFILFVNNALNIKSVIQKIKIDEISKLTKEYNDIHNKIILSIKNADENINVLTITRANYILTSIERITKLKEWPIDLLNASMLFTSFLIQIFQVLLQRFLSLNS